MQYSTVQYSTVQYSTVQYSTVQHLMCVESRVAVLENQNKALIEELKSLKELYTTGESPEVEII